MLAYLYPILAVAETACPADHVDEVARVRYVHDGDTVHLNDGRKIRIIGINTPELARDNAPAQAYAREARTALILAISAYDNHVGLVYGKERQDRHHRTLAHLFSPDGDNIQAQLLQQGLAAAISHPPNIAYAACYKRQEKTARCAGQGIWSQPDRAIIQADDLSAESMGFQLVRGKVEHVSQSARGIWLFMSELMVGIRRENLAEFDKAQLLSLQGKQLTVRGWLQPSNRSSANNKSGHARTVNFYMRMRHPASMEINQAGVDSKC